MPKSARASTWLRDLNSTASFNLHAAIDKHQQYSRNVENERKNQLQFLQNHVSRVVRRHKVMGVRTGADRLSLS
jgi:hypothetical protein